MRLLLALLLLAPLAPAQSRVYTVGGTAPDYPTLPLAVQASSEGDVLLVRPGTYGAFTLAGKGLSIVFESDPGALVNLAVVEGDRVRIEGLPSGSQVVLHGLVLREGLTLADCEGTVFLRQVVLGNGGYVTPPPPLLLEDPALDVSDCGNVLLTSVQVTNVRGVAGLRSRRSTVHLWDCAIVGGKGLGGSASGNPSSGFAGVINDRSELLAAQCLFVGGEGGDAQPGSAFCFGGSGGAGLWQQEASSSTLLRDGNVQGGDGGAGDCVAGATGQALQVGGGTFQLLAEGRGRALLLPPLLEEGERVRLTAFGEPDAAAFWVGTTSAAGTFLPSLATGSLLDPNPPLLRFLGRSNGLGVIQAELGHAPDLGAREGLQVYSQVVFLESKTLRGTPPVGTILLGEAF